MHHGKFALKKCQRKLKSFNTADVRPVESGRNIWDHCDLSDVFSLINEERKLRENVPVPLVNDERTCFTFCIYLFREIYFF